MWQGPSSKFLASVLTVAATFILAGSLACSGEPAPTPPRDPTIIEAQPFVPFPIQAPDYIPEGYKMDPTVKFNDGFQYGHEIKGIFFKLQKYTPDGYHTITINQFLAEGTFPPVRAYLPSVSTWETIDLGEFQAEVRQTNSGNNNVPQVAVEWEITHQSKRIFYAVVSDVSLEETLKLVESFQPISLPTES